MRIDIHPWNRIMDFYNKQNIQLCGKNMSTVLRGKIKMEILSFITLNNQ